MKKEIDNYKVKAFKKAFVVVASPSRYRFPY